MVRKQIECAAGIIQNAENKILIAKRPLHKPWGGFWEFPGGKIEPEELAADALARELLEELGISADPTSFKDKELLSYSFDYPNYSVLLEFFLVSEFTGEPQALEGQSIQWVNISELGNYQMLEGNLRMVEELTRLFSSERV